MSTGIRGLFESIKKFFENLDWHQIGKSIATFIGNIDWNGMVRDVAYILGQAIAGIGLFLWGFIEDAVKSIGDYFGEKIEECGRNIVLGLLKGIADALFGIVQWLDENVVTPIIKGIMSLFGIHSPSMIFAEIGKFLIEGLLKGVKDIWDSIVKFFTSKLSGIKEIFNTAWKNIQNVFNNVGSWFSSKFSGAWTGIKDAFSGVGNLFSGVWTNIKHTPTILL